MDHDDGDGNGAAPQQEGPLRSTLCGHMQATELSLAHSPDLFLLLPVEITHAIDERSPLYGRTIDDLIRSDMELVVVVEATFATMSTALQALQSYRAEDIVVGRSFQSLIVKDTTKGRYHVDMQLFASHTVPLWFCNDSATMS